jgi:hypothetical protein
MAKPEDNSIPLESSLLIRLRVLDDKNLDVGTWRWGFDKLVFAYIVEIGDDITSVHIDAGAKHSDTFILFDPGEHFNPQKTRSVDITVGTESNTMHYIINFVAPGEILEQAYLDNIELSQAESGVRLDQEFERTVTKYTVLVPFGIIEFAVIGVPASSVYYVAYNPRPIVTMSNDMEPMTICVYGRNYAPTNYTLDFNFTDPEHARLSAIILSAGSLEGAPFFDNTKLEHTVNLPKSAGNVYVTGISEKSSFKIKYNGSDESDKESIEITDFSSKLEISVIGTAGYSTTTYSISFNKTNMDAAVLDDITHNLSGLASLVQAGPGASSSGFNASHTYYTLKVPEGSQNVTVTGITYSSKEIAYSCDRGERAAGGYRVDFLSSIPATPPLTITASATGCVTTSYSLRFSNASGIAQARLKDIECRGGELRQGDDGPTGFSPSCLNYTLKVPRDVPAAIVTGIPEVDFFAVAYDPENYYYTGPGEKSDGDTKTIKITVSGGAGYTPTTYQINVKKEGEIAIDKLIINGGTVTVNDININPPYIEINNTDAPEKFNIIVTHSQSIKVAFDGNTTTASGASVSYNTVENVLMGVSKQIKIKLTDDNSGFSKEYLLNLYRPSEYYVSANGNDSNNGETDVNAFKNLNKAINAAVESKCNKVTVIGTVFINEDISKGTVEPLTISGINAAALTAGTNSNVLVIKKNDADTNAPNIRLENINIKGAYNANGVKIENKSTLTLGNGAYISGNTLTSGNGAGVYVGAGATLNIASGAVITGNKVNTGSGGGIYNAGTVTMDGGIIQSNSAGNGGGIYNTGIVNMNGGQIYVNSATKGIGVYQNGIFRMGTAGSSYPKLYSNDDIFLPQGKYVIPAIITQHGASVSNPAAKITPESYTHGVQILASNESGTILGSSYGTTSVCFTVSDQGSLHNAIDSAGKLLYSVYYYVNATGNDSNTGLNAGSPFQTLSHALIKAKETQIKTILLTSDISCKGEFSDLGDVSIMGEKNSITLSVSSSGSIKFTGNSTVYFDTITLNDSTNITAEPPAKITVR